MLDDRTLAAAARAAGVDRLTGLDQLGGSDRSEVWRVVDQAGTSYVVKRYRSREDATWAREPAALAALAGTGVGPRLVGVAQDPDLVVLADLGSHPTVADRLLGRDPSAAGAAVDAWTDAIAALHLVADEAVLDAYGRHLGATSPETQTHVMPGTLAYSADRFRELGERIGLPVPVAFDEALRELHAGFSAQAPVLTPADACPDNNLITGDGVVLLDYEFACLQHLVWDVAYLRVPWPTCWCSWRLPDAVAEAAVERYRTRVAPSLPYVGTDAFLVDLDLATLGWCLSSSSWRIEAALAEDQDAAPGLAGPTIRPVVLHRLWLAGRLPGPDALTTYARDLSRELVRRWGEPTLVLAPAFRSDEILIP